MVIGLRRERTRLVRRGVRLSRKACLVSVRKTRGALRDMCRGRGTCSGVCSRECTEDEEEEEESGRALSRRVRRL
jgi:MinD superfamily P-loop ATPase